jgi:sigma-B regulation protein RsbU (phosphoserine phosphatase)
LQSIAINPYWIGFTTIYQFFSNQCQLYLSGQHESVIVVRANGEIEIIDTDSLGFPIRLTDEINEFIFEVEIYLNLGDVVLSYANGIPEAENKSK